MKRYTFIIIAIFLLSIPEVSCRAFAPDPSILLENLFRRILNTNNDNERIRLNDSVKVIIDNYAASDSVFVH
ncbi:MAG: hypothetical protein ABSA76_07965, partial [Bacteroidales bacterium]